MFVAWLNRFSSEEKLLTSLKLGIIIPAPLSINANHQTAGTCTITLVLDRLACYVTENNSFLTRERQRNHRFVETKIREQNLARSVKQLQFLAFLASLILACCEKCCCKMQMFSGYQFLRMYVCVCVCVFMNARGEREEIGQGFQFRVRGIVTCGARRAAAGAATTDEQLLLRRPHTACIVFSCPSHDQPCFGIDFLPV